MIKNIIFDWDGVIKDSFTKFYEVCKIIFKEFGKEPISMDEIKRTYDTPFMNFWKYHFPNLNEEKGRKVYKQVYGKIPPAKLYKGAIETIKELKERNIKMFIVSSSLTSELILDLKKNKVLNMFEKIFTEVNEKVPPINSLIKNYSLDKDKTLIVGDTTGDLKAGQEAGIKTIGITWGFQSKEKLSTANPDIIIDDIKELIEVIDKEKL